LFKPDIISNITAMKPIRILLADDHNLVRSGLNSLLSGMNGVEVVAEAANGRQAVALAGSLIAWKE